MTATGYEAGEGVSTVDPERAERRRLMGGIAALLGGVIIFSLQDVIIKSISGGYPVHEIVLIRSVAALLPILLLAHIDGGIGSLRTRRLGFHMLRSLTLFATYTSFYLALAALPLAETVTLFFASPLFITILSGVVLRESVDMGAKMAVVAGFIGVVVMFDPGAGLFDPAALLALFSAFSYACMAIATRRLGRSEKGPSLAFYPTLVYLGLTLVIGVIFGDGSRAVDHHPSLRFLTDGWRLPAQEDLTLMLLLGPMSALGFYCLSQAYRLAPPGRIAPLEYIAVPLGVLWGFLFWQEIPAGRSFLAMMLIVGSGLFILGRGHPAWRRGLTSPFRVWGRRN